MKNEKSKFKDKVIVTVSKITRGKTLTYKEVASRAGSPKAYRTVGNILNRYYKLNHSEKYSLPCHRVIRSDGKIGGYGGGKEIKQKLLDKEI